MNLSRPFIQRPAGTTLLMLAVALAGLVAYCYLPMAPLPQVDYPTINISASLPGASPEIMASSVATPLERQFGRIADITEMTSSSGLGSTSITIQFDLSRDIDGAARDVQAAINAARTYLPIDLPSNPTYRKVNPSDAPIMNFGLSSKIYDKAVLFDAASTIIEQRLSQVQGVGQVTVGGSSLPAVRVELNPTQLNHYGVSFQQVANVLSAQNANIPKGQISNRSTTADILANDQLLKAEYYRPLVVGFNDGAAIRLSDVADVEDSVQDIRNAGYVNGDPSVSMSVFRQPGANIIDTVDRVRDAMPSLRASIPAGIKLTTVADRSTMIRASVKDVERSLLISIALVVLVVFLFLRSAPATFIPGVVVPISLLGTAGVMYLCGYTIDNLSLMALTIATGFVVDDAIVVIENITRHMEGGMPPMEAALKGAQEVGFTVLSMSISLIAVFIPILLMAGIVGRLFREFAVTLSAAILMSMLISLTATPMMCARLLKDLHAESQGRFYRVSERVFAWILGLYERTLNIVLEHRATTLTMLLLTIGVNVYLLKIVPKGFFPQQDNGTIQGGIQGSQDISFQAMDTLTRRFVDIIRTDPAVENVMAYTGGSIVNTGSVQVGLKPESEREATADQVINRLRARLTSLPGATAYLQAGQDLRIGGRRSNAQFQYTLQSDSVQDLVKWGPLLVQRLKKTPEFTDVNTDQQNSGLQEYVDYDRESAARMGITAEQMDTTLYDAFGQSLASTMYTPLNQYYVVMEVAPEFWQSPGALNDIYVSSQTGGAVPLGAIAHFDARTAPLAVNHQGQFPSVTVSFNLGPGVALSDASALINKAKDSLGMPASIHGMFSGTLQAFQTSLASEPFLIATALMAVFIVLGILYESLIHPITILSTIPSAGVGAILALFFFRTDLSIVAMIGMILLIGIVKKNAIIMIDFALAAQRNEGIGPRDAIFQACLLRFRPILMTTMAALFGAMPLALGIGSGGELRRPLGITIVGGLILSQMLTLYTTPVVYLYMDRVSSWWHRAHSHARLEAPQQIAD
jgi:multidrug efflux pump